jgi:hypothetical protein
MNFMIEVTKGYPALPMNHREMIPGNRLERMNFLSQELQQRTALRPTVTKGEGIDVAKLIASEIPTTDEAATREYFFQAGVDEWYNSLEGFTFPSKFVTLSPEVYSPLPQLFTH